MPWFEIGYVIVQRALTENIKRLQACLSDLDHMVTGVSEELLDDEIDSWFVDIG